MNLKRTKNLNLHLAVAETLLPKPPWTDEKAHKYYWTVKELAEFCQITTAGFRAIERKALEKVCQALRAKGQL